MKSHGGFTLIELMMVVAILGILAAIAYPNYTDYVRNGHRADARAQLLEAAQFMERTFTLTSDYSVAVGGGAIVLPAALVQAPKPPGAATYNISLNPAATQTTFTLQAVPAAGGPMAGDVCGTLTLTESGVQGSAGNVAMCWGR
jgi:type IV pilus assembly protein PilE